MRKPGRPRKPVPFALRPGSIIAAAVTALFIRAAWVFHVTGAPVSKVIGAGLAACGISMMVAALIQQGDA